MREELKLALEALENHCGNYKLDDAGCKRWNKAVAAINEALEQPDYRAVKTYHEGKPVYVSQPEQEPVAKVIRNSAGQISMQSPDGNALDMSGYVDQSFYTTPPEPQPAQVGQEVVAWQERHAKRMRDGFVTEWTNWYPCPHRSIDEARGNVSDHIPYEWRPLYIRPPQRPWVGLTDEEIETCRERAFSTNNPYCPVDKKSMWKAYQYLEAKLKEKNT